MDYDKKESRYFNNERLGMLQFVPVKAKTILEVGCAAGKFAKKIRERQSCEYWGVEPNKEAANSANQYLDKVIDSNFEMGMDLPNSYFDCIVFNDVLEHLYDPWEALKYSRTLLSDDGVVVASIPNFFYYPNLRELFLSREFRYRHHGIMDFTHLRFFTKKSILKMFDQTGFDIDLIKGVKPYNKARPIKYLLKFNYKKFEEFQYLQYAVLARKS